MQQLDEYMTMLVSGGGVAGQMVDTDGDGVPDTLVDCTGPFEDPFKDNL